MKKSTILFLSAMFILTSCGQNEVIDENYVIAQFKKYSEKIEKSEYKVQRIDTFPGGDVWNNTGFAFLERNNNDEIFKFSFYGKRNDVDNVYLYDNGNGFQINNSDKNYRLIYAGGMLGSPGGQMVVENIFHLDSTYTSVELLEEQNSYLLKYTFEPDTVYDISNQEKTVELRKSDFFPMKVTYQANKLGKHTSTQHLLSDVKINDAVNNSISDYKNLIANYDVIPPTHTAPNAILNQEFPLIELSNLLDENQKINLNPGKVMLIDFWEVWCSPCIKSFPKVEELRKKYSDELQVVGIVSQNKERAKKLVKDKHIFFLNLIGSKELLETYSVNSFPRYFLIDKEGTVRKEYHGFTDEIEKDIKIILSE